MFLRFKNNRDLDDLELIRRYKQTGEESYVGILFERYTHLVFGVCMKMLKNEEESKDQTMSVFEDLLEKLKVHDITNFPAWLHQVSRNSCLMYLRKQKSIAGKHDNVAFLYQNDVENDFYEHHSNGVEKELSLQQLEEAIKKLNQEQRECIELFYLQEKSYKEVAEKTGYDLNQVKSFIQNGKRNLKIIMERNG